MCFSIFFSTGDTQLVIPSTDDVTRDFTYGETNPLVRRCRLLPWVQVDLEGVSSATTEPPDSYYEVRTVSLVLVAESELSSLQTLLLYY